VRHGLVGCIELGQTEVAKMLGGVLYMGVITRFQQPQYQVTYEDGDTEEHTGRELARILKLKVNEITDPRRFYYDWSGLSMVDVPGFVEHLVGYLAQYSTKLPSV
jgi:thioredoxin-related protein